MIPQPDLFVHYVLGFMGIGIIMSGVIFGLKYDSLGFTYIGMVLGFIAILFGLSGASGLADFTEGELDLWREQVKVEYINTECPYLENLSNEYDDSNIDRYTVKQIQNEIESHYIYKCVETRDYVFNGERRGQS